MKVSKRTREDARVRVLRKIENNPQITQRELAVQLGVSIGSAHYLLSALIESGMVKPTKDPCGFGKQRYQLTRLGLLEKAELTGKFLARRLEEYAALREEIQELRKELSEEQQKLSRFKPSKVKSLN